MYTLHGDIFFSIFSGYSLYNDTMFIKHYSITIDIGYAERRPLFINMFYAYDTYSY